MLADFFFFYRNNLFYVLWNCFLFFLTYNTVNYRDFFINFYEEKDETMKVGVIVELLGKPLLEGIAEAARIGAEGIQIYGGHGGHGYNFVDLKDDEIK